MTIDEATEILGNERNDHHSYPTDTIGKAEGLGIEALKTIKAERTIYGFKRLVRLPGETED